MTAHASAGESVQAIPETSRAERVVADVLAIGASAVDAERVRDSVPLWFHTFALAPGIYTPGIARDHGYRLAVLRADRFAGRSVLSWKKHSDERRLRHSLVVQLESLGLGWQDSRNHQKQARRDRHPIMQDHLSAGSVDMTAGMSPREQRASASMSRLLETGFEDRRAPTWHRCASGTTLRGGEAGGCSAR